MAEHDLLIGLGNSLRGDDGVGGHLAMWAQGLGSQAGCCRGHGLPLQVRMVQQLTPELCGELAAASRVLFIDAWQVPKPDAPLIGRASLPIPAGTVERSQAPLVVAETQAAAARGAMDAPAEWLSARRPGGEATEWSTTGASAVGVDVGDLCHFGPVLMCLAPSPHAAVDAGEVGAFSHRLDPQQLLAITALLHGQVPEAWLLLVPAYRFEHGEALSAELQAWLPQARSLLQQWISRDAEKRQGQIGPAQGSAAPPANRRPETPAALPAAPCTHQARRHA